MNINVPKWAEAEFWDEPPEGTWEFWSFRFPPPCKVGDQLVFKMRGIVVARAVVAAIEQPGESECEHSGRFRSGWKVFWDPADFVEDATGRSQLRGGKNATAVGGLYARGQ